MIEFRWMEVEHPELLDGDDAVRRWADSAPVVLQWRVGIHKISTNEDVWEDWQTVPFDPDVKL
jgi:hypothetical protein